MDADTANHLLELNRQFYQTFAHQFAATRQRLQPGVQRILASLSPHWDILDLGCGNGELWRALKRAGHKGRYVGLDFSLEMLQVATSDDPDSLLVVHPVYADVPCIPSTTTTSAVFFQADLGAADWDTLIAGSTFNVILAFAVLHHLPGQTLHRNVLHKVRKLLAPFGRFIHSEWQFLNSARLRKRIQPWGTIDISANQVEPNDYLLDWRHGGYGLRYVHHFNEAELHRLALESGFRIIESFHSDGEGGNLGLYQTWISGS